MVTTPEDVTSEEMDPSDFDNWDFGKKKLSTVRIFRPDTTYTTVNCVSNITASELSTMLGKKIFKPDISKYHLYILRNDVGKSFLCFVLPMMTRSSLCHRPRLLQPSRKMKDF